MIYIARFIPFFTGEYGGPYKHIVEVSKYLKKYNINTIVYTSSDLNQSGKRKVQSGQQIIEHLKIKRYFSYLKFKDYRITPSLFFS